ncbi:MAG: hypothetical protein OHK0028_07330 [Deltaproteobacteria bacterium]
MEPFKKFFPFGAVLSVAVFLLAGCWWSDNEDQTTPRQGHLLDNNTLALWRLNETSASDNAADATGSYPLIQFGSPDVVSGQIGNGRRTDGSTKFFQKQGDAALGTALNGDWTFEGWVYLDNTFGSQGILFIYNGLDFSIFPSDVILAEVGVLGTRKVYVHQWHNTGSYDEITTTGTLDTAKFHHVAVTRTAEGGNNFTYRFYIDGVLDNTTATVPGTDSPVAGGSHYIGLGCYTGDTGYGAGGAVFNGRLDDVRISKVARSGAEILSSYNRGK